MIGCGTPTTPVPVLTVSNRGRDTLALVAYDTVWFARSSLDPTPIATSDFRRIANGGIAAPGTSARLEAGASDAGFKLGQPVWLNLYRISQDSARYVRSEFFSADSLRHAGFRLVVALQ